jgi:DNA-directed RNA polymerase specialized sigma24 family protein
VRVSAGPVEFGEFVRTRSRDLLRTGWLLTGDWGLAEGLVQTALMRCWPALATLSPRQRAVLVLRYYLDLSEADTAATLGIAAGSVKRYSADALATLRIAPSLRELLTEEVTQ